MFILCSFLPSESCISTALAAVGAALSVMEEKDQRIPACIADIVGDTVGDIVWKLLSGLC